MVTTPRFRPIPRPLPAAAVLSFCASAWLCTGAAQLNATEPPSSAGDASYVFLGTVEAASASTVQGLAGSEETYSVRVEEIRYQAGSFTDQTGKPLTLLAGATSLVEGERYIFHTEPFLFGKSLAAQLLAAEPSTDREGGRAIVNLSEKRLLERVGLADLIVVGHVEEVQLLGPAPEADSEHHPELHTARIQVEKAVKGARAVGEVEAVFAASIDVQWYRAPKLGVGDRGVFLLHVADADLAVSGVSPGQLTVFHPLDFQPADRLTQIEELLP